MGARRTREEWAALVEKLEASGGSVERFCTKHRVRASTLKWWRWRLRHERRPAALAMPSARLLAVDVIDIAPPRPTTLVIAASGLELRVEVGTDAEYVGALVSALRSRC
jgi:hypothetical protein